MVPVIVLFECPKIEPIELTLFFAVSKQCVRMIAVEGKEEPFLHDISLPQQKEFAKLLGTFCMLYTMLYIIVYIMLYIVIYSMQLYAIYHDTYNVI